MNHFLCMHLEYNFLRTCTHTTCSQVHPPQLTHSSPDLCPRATSISMPLPHRLVCLFCDLSHACICIFKSHLFRPYCVDDLWTTVHHPDMGHHLCHRNQLTIPEFCLSYFLTPKNNENIAERSCFLSCSIKYTKGHLHRLIYLLLRTM